MLQGFRTQVTRIQVYMNSGYNLDHEQFPWTKVGRNWKFCMDEHSNT
jgi:hypothetical protein